MAFFFNLFDFQEMNMTNRASFVSMSLKAVSLGVVLLLGAQAPDVMARERMTQVTGAGGKTATRQVQRSGGDVSSTATGPNGKTASRTVDRSAGGTTATVTGPNGQSATRTTTTTTSTSGSSTGTAP
jgi:hypothetical protein